MTEKQRKNLNEVIFSLSVEGFIVPDNEKEALIGILEGKRTYQEVLSEYIAEAKSYARI